MRESPKDSLNFHDEFVNCTHKEKVGNTSVTYTLMESEERTYEPTVKPTVCVIPGLGFRHNTYEKALGTLHSSGRSFCAFGYVEAGLPIPPEAEEWIDKKLVSTRHVQRALGFIEMIKSLSDSARHPKSNLRPPVDVIAHSMGAIYAVVAAALEPRLFRSLVLYAPAGFIETHEEGEDDEIRRLRHAVMDAETIARNQRLFLAQGVEGEYARDYLGKAMGGLRTFSMQHFLNLPSQIRSVTSAFVPPILQIAQDKGVKASVEIGEKEALFPEDLLLPALEKYGIPHQQHANADHHTIGTEEYMIKALEERLSAMNAESHRR